MSPAVSAASATGDVKAAPVWSFFDCVQEIACFKFFCKIKSILDLCNVFKCLTWCLLKLFCKVLDAFLYRKTDLGIITATKLLSSVIEVAQNCLNSCFLKFKIQPSSHKALVSLHSNDRLVLSAKLMPRLPDLDKTLVCRHVLMLGLSSHIVNWLRSLY